MYSNVIFIMLYIAPENLFILWLEAYIFSFDEV